MRVLQGGTQAVGAPLAGLQRGAPADLVVLDDDDPMLAGHATDTLLDALVFSGFSLPIDRVMVHGEWRVIDGRHIARNEARSGYARAIEHIWAQS